MYRQEEAENARELHIAEVLGVTVDDVRMNWITADAADRIAALIERARTLPLQQVSHRNFEDMTKEEDLITLLTDADDVADDSK